MQEESHLNPAMGFGFRLCSEPTPFKLTKYFAGHGMHISTAVMAAIPRCAGELLLLLWLWSVSDNRARLREGVQLSTLVFYIPLGTGVFQTTWPPLWAKLEEHF